jgi:hypothetical protein
MHPVFSFRIGAGGRIRVFFTQSPRIQLHNTGSPHLRLDDKISTVLFSSEVSTSGEADAALSTAATRYTGITQ